MFDRASLGVSLLSAVCLMGAASVHAQPVRPGPPSASSADKVQAFCAAMHQLATLAPQGFRPVDLGPIPADRVNHRSAISLPDSTECYIATDMKPPTHTCFMPSRPETLARQTHGLANLIGRCLAAAPEAAYDDDTGTMMYVQAGDVSYTILGDDTGLSVSVHATSPKR